jgi:hypothetical protein
MNTRKARSVSRGEPSQASQISDQEPMRHVLEPSPPDSRLLALISGVGQEKSHAIRLRNEGEGALELCQHPRTRLEVDVPLKLRSFEIDQQGLSRCFRTRQKVVGCEVVLEKPRIVGAPREIPKGRGKASARRRTEPSLPCEMEDIGGAFDDRDQEKARPKYGSPATFSRGQGQRERKSSRVETFGHTQLVESVGRSAKAPQGHVPGIAIASQEKVGVLSAS